MYPAAEPDALVDIVLICVVVPLDALQKGCRADQQQDVGKKMIVTDEASSRAACGHSPKT